MLVLFAQTSFAGQYIVKFKNPISTKNLNTIKAITNGEVESLIPQLNMAVISGQPTQINTLSLSMGNEIEYIEVNHKRYAIGKKGPSYPSEVNMWGMRAINALPAWAITKGSRKVIIAVSDTGTWLEHSDLKNNLWRNAGETGLDANGKDKTKNKIDDDGNGYIDDVHGYNFETNVGNPMENHYHGTHVAGSIGAVGNNSGIAGVNWETSLMTVKFIGMDGSGTDDAAIKSIVYAADNGAKVINASWGGDEFAQALYDAIDYAGKKGVLFVAASGNDGQNADKYPMYPAAYDLDSIISVASISDVKGKLSGFSNYGAKSVDIAAPGENIYSTWNPMQSPLRRVLYYTISGTSMAAPHVTGVVGLMYAANPNLTSKQVKSILIETAKLTPHLTGKVLANGMVDAGAAVKKAKELAGSN